MNQSMDDLLRDTLRRRSDDSTAACVDAETAAAFVDGRLSARARSSAEAHLADCSRCQAVLAALVRSTPPPTPRTWWRRPALAWLVPAAVAAGAVAIWINVPGAPLPSVQPQREALPPPVDSRQSAVDSRQSAVDSRQSAVDSRQSSVDNRQSSPSPAAVKDSRSGDAETLRLRQTGAGAAAKTSSPVASADGTARREARQDTAPSDFRMAAAAAPLPPAPETPAPRTAALERVTIVTPVRATIVSPDRTSQWRIDANGAVQHSADSGASWQTQATGTTLTPVAGSSPSSSVCWLVGRAGLVLVTTDSGGSWQRLSFPVAIDLASVRAADDRTASIVSVDGRTFTTSDAGTSWK